MDTNQDQKIKTLMQNKSVLAGLIFLVLLLVGAIGTSYYFYNKLKSVEIKNPEAELQDIIKMVGKHMVLPNNENPTMATVSDPEKLKDQPFFKNAKKGDKVLIFSLSQKAILYDPVGDRIVEVAPINAKVNAPASY